MTFSLCSCLLVLKFNSSPKEVKCKVKYVRHKEKLFCFSVWHFSKKLKCWILKYLRTFNTTSWLEIRYEICCFCPLKSLHSWSRGSWVAGCIEHSHCRGSTCCRVARLQCWLCYPQAPWKKRVLCHNCAGAAAAAAALSKWSWKGEKCYKILNYEKPCVSF